MKRALLVFCFLSPVIFSYSQRKETGWWRGVIDIGVNLMVNMQITKDFLNQLVAVLDSSEDNEQDEYRLLRAKILNDSIWMKSSENGLQFSGFFLSDSTISGNWNLGTINYPLILSKQDN